MKFLGLVEMRSCRNENAMIIYFRVYKIVYNLSVVRGNYDPRWAQHGGSATVLVPPLWLLTVGEAALRCELSHGTQGPGSIYAIVSGPDTLPRTKLTTVEIKTN